MVKHSQLRPTGHGTVQRIALIEFHVVPNGDRWDVERDDTFTGAFSYNVHVAIGLAVAAAQRDYHNGEDVMVCVQELDGCCRKVWP